MSPELLGTAAAWLCHTSWFLADPARRRSSGLTWQAPSSGVTGIAAFGLGAVALALWVQAHGLAIGICSALAALTAAASANTIVAPLWPRAVLIWGATSAALLVLGIIGALGAT